MPELHLGVLFILGIGVFGGIIGATVFQRLRIPQVVGYIAIGILIGRSGLHLVSSSDILHFRPLNLFALGLIGFLVGGELHADTFRKYGRQFSAILFGEGLSAFILVGAATFLAVWHFVGGLATSLAAGIVLGAIASATDPASTISVLWEYRARGMVTTTLIAIVALDDALAMTLYGVGTSAAQLLTGGSSAILDAVLRVLLHLGGAVALGFGLGSLLNGILRGIRNRDEALVTCLAAVLLATGIAVACDMDVILASMTLGLTLTNLAPRRSRELFGMVKDLSIPIYVIFFVFVGARLVVGEMPPWLWTIIALYVVFRSLGKMGGAAFGARIAGAPAAVRRYCGLGLFAQGGVAVGLSIMASQHLTGTAVTPEMSLGDMIIFAVTATTLIVQLLGPPMVKLAIRITGEIDRNVTDDDIIASWTVKDAMREEFVVIGERDNLNAVFRAFSEHANLSYPVVDPEGRIAGIITLERVKDVLARQETWEWIVAGDVMIPVREVATPSTPLKEALELMRQLRFDRIPVVRSREDRRAVGILDMRRARYLVSEEVIRRRRALGRGEADATT